MPSSKKERRATGEQRGATDSAAAVISKVLADAAPRPASDAPQGEKNNYAVRFADAMAQALARDLHPMFEGIAATTKREAMSVFGKKQLDVNFSTPHHGLALGISLKSVHLREPAGAQRYTHNKKRNEEELRIEATGYHKRQPYAVMVGVLFLPFDSCTDARQARTPSSFGSWVRHLRPYTGRSAPSDEADRFERLYVALYEPDGSDLRFFDVLCAPPKNGKPRADGELFGPRGRDEPPLRLLTYAEFLEEVHHLFLRRNSAEFHWQSGEEDPLGEGDEENSD